MAVTTCHGATLEHPDAQTMINQFLYLTSITKEQPFFTYRELTDLKYDMVEQGMNLEYFHGAEDAQAVHDSAFEIIQRNLAGIRIDSLVVEKQRTGASLHDTLLPRLIFGELQ